MFAFEAHLFACPCELSWACCYTRDKRSDHPCPSIYCTENIDCWFLGSSSFYDTWSPVTREISRGTNSFSISPPQEVSLPSLCFSSQMDRLGQNVIVHDPQSFLFMHHQ